MEHGLLDDDDFRACMFTNAVSFWGEVNPDFFKGTAVETPAKEMLAASERRGQSMRTWINIMAWGLSACLLAPSGAVAQLPGTGSLSIPSSLPSKSQLLDQVKQLLQELTSMKSSGKLTPDQTGKVDTLLPKAQGLNTELEKPQVDTSKLSQLTKELTDLQKQVGALKATVK
ncbi:MAG TPA: hypothetical protein VMS64_12070 [Candidatus Methylomirabilis sp.]|nr:hypothetical protein [Candidatus Methylomirabilis sp.]